MLRIGSQPGLHGEFQVIMRPSLKEEKEVGRGGACWRQRQRQADLKEFKAILVYVVCFRPVKVTE